MRRSNLITVSSSQCLPNKLPFVIKLAITYTTQQLAHSIKIPMSFSFVSQLEVGGHWLAPFGWQLMPTFGIEGIPPPVLLWYKNGVMIDGSYVVGKNGTVWNELTVYKLSPRDLLDRYVCKTSSSVNSSEPIEAHVTIDINRRCPLLSLLCALVTAF